MGKKKKKISKNTWITIVAILVVIIGICAALASPYFFKGAPKSGTIYIRKGITKEALEDSITNNIGGDYASSVMDLLNWSKTDVTTRHGAFIVDKGESAFHLFRRIHSGASSGMKFTFNNVRTKDELIARAASVFMGSRSDFKKVLNDPKECAKYGKTPDNIIMLFIPDSYEFKWDITPEKLLERMNEYYKKFWTDERKEKAKKLGLTPDQVTIIASIAEEETSKADERGKVGRLYINRLKANMRLQADPTVKFAIGDFSIKRITVAMTQTQSPYNTYRVNGLPPGPIRLPEKATIDSILDSEPHNYMYMCANSDFSGYHVFAVDYATHTANARKYQEELNKRNIK